MQRCYLGKLNRKEFLDEWEWMRHDKRKRYCIFNSIVGGYCVMSSDNISKCYLYPSLNTFDTMERALRYSHDSLRAYIPLDRSESFKHRPIAVQNRQNAVYAWMMCAQRLGLLKDVRRLIGEYVFKTELKEWI